MLCLARDSNLLFSQCVQDGRAADGETHYCAQRRDRQEIVSGMNDVGGQCRDRTDDSQYIKPKRRAHVRAEIFPETELHQQRRQADGRNHDQRQRTGEGRTTRIDDHQREREK